MFHKYCKFNDSDVYFGNQNKPSFTDTIVLRRNRVACTKLQNVVIVAYRLSIYVIAVRWIVSIIFSVILYTLRICHDVAHA